MPERVARNRIIVGSGDDRKVIEPGQRFRTEDYGLSADELEAWDESGVVRNLRDMQDVPVPAGTGPRDPVVDEAVVEGRSGPVHGDATSDMPNRLNRRTDGGDDADRRVPRAPPHRGRHADNPDDI